MKIVIYLFLVATGFYFGRYLGALTLPLLFYWGLQSLHSDRQFSRQSSRKSTGQTGGCSSSIAWAYRELGVSADADIHTIGRARKKLLNRYHPDKSVHASEREKQRASQKVYTINKAYDAIKQARGF